MSATRIHRSRPFRNSFSRLTNEVETGSMLLGQAVLGGAELGGDEGFSGFGPPRYLTAAQVADLGKVLSRPEVETEAAARFDAAKMSQLEIYPGWRSSDAEWVAEYVMDASVDGALFKWTREARACDYNLPG